MLFSIWARSPWCHSSENCFPINRPVNQSSKTCHISLNKAEILRNSSSLHQVNPTWTRSWSELTQPIPDPTQIFSVRSTHSFVMAWLTVKFPKCCGINKPLFIPIMANTANSLVAAITYNSSQTSLANTVCKPSRYATSCVSGYDIFEWSWVVTSVFEAAYHISPHHKVCATQYVLICIRKGLR